MGKKVIRAYVRFVKNQMFVGHRDDRNQVRDQRFLGYEGFVDRVEENKTVLFLIITEMFPILRLLRLINYPDLHFKL